MYDWDTWDSRPVPRALTAEVSPHVESLSSPKREVSDYKPPQEEIHWRFNETLKNFQPSDRLNHLSAPKSRCSWTGPYDPNWYEVKPTALKAVASERIASLAAPVPRKISSPKKL